MYFISFFFIDRELLKEVNVLKKVFSVVAFSDVVV